MFAGDHSAHASTPHRFPDLHSRQVALALVEPRPHRRVHLKPDHLDQDLAVLQLPNWRFDNLDVLVRKHSLRSSPEDNLSIRALRVHG